MHDQNTSTHLSNPFPILSQSFPLGIKKVLFESPERDVVQDHIGCEPHPEQVLDLGLGESFGSFHENFWDVKKVDLAGA